MVIPGNDLIAGSAITLGTIQMIVRAINIDSLPVGENTMYFLYMGIIGNILWLTYQYRKGANYSAMYSTVAFADVKHKFDFAIVESSSTTLAEFWVQFPFAYKVLKTLSVMMPKYEKKIDFKAQIKEVKHLQSILFMYSENDSWVPVHMGKKLQENTNVSTEFWLAKDAEHAEIMKSTDKEKYQARILKFFNQEVVKYNDSKVKGA